MGNWLFQTQRAFLVLLAIAGWTAPLPGDAHAQQTSVDTGADFEARTLVHILDYVAQDYALAIADGQIISELEYEEMLQFGMTATSLVGRLAELEEMDTSSGAGERVASLVEAINAKVDPPVVAQIARGLRDVVIAETGLRMSPARWPDIEGGRELYAANCAMCHGARGRGDGEKAPGLDPAPANFLEGSRPAELAPYQAYNTIRLGVEGTSMAAFDSLAETQIWNLAFYVKSLQSEARFPDDELRSRALNDAQGVITLSDAATMGDADLLDLLQRSSAPDPELTVAAIRTAGPEDHGGTPLALARILLNQSMEHYQAGRHSEATRTAVSAYLQGIEPVEPSLRADDLDLVRTLERDMMDLRSSMSSGDSPEEVQELVLAVQASIRQAEDVLADRHQTAWFAFVLATSILLREGLEAFLIIMAILGVLYSTDKKYAAKWVHAGWILAVLVGLAGWFLVDLLLNFGAAQRELLEGGIALLAVVVLVYVGFWLHSKTSAEKWNRFIDERIHKQLTTGSLWGLTGIAFFAVFREAFESVLFLSALTLEEGGGGTNAALAGAATVTFVFILALGFIFVRTSKKLPLKQLFRYASFAMAFLAVVLVGKGIHALQEAGKLPVKTLPFSFQFDLMGIFPTVETLLAQLVVVGIVLLLWIVPMTTRKRPLAGLS